VKGHRGKTVLGLAITVVLLAWVLRDVSALAVLRELRRADPWLLLAMTAVATGGFLVRAFRWSVLLAPVHTGSTLRSRFGAVCIGFMANNVLPARLGELARAYALGRVEEIELSACLASLVAERLFDGLVLAACLFAVLLLPGSPVARAQGADAIRHVAWVAAAVFIGGFALLWTFARHPAPSLRLFEHTIGRVLGPRLTDRAVSMLASFLGGLGALHRPAIFVRALAWSVFLWVWLAASIWLGLLAFGIRSPGFAGALFIQAVIGFAVAVPASPGFFGTFEAGALLGLGAYGIGRESIVGFAIGYHILTFLPVTLIGLWYLRSFGITLGDVERSERAVAVP